MKKIKFQNFWALNTCVKVTLYVCSSICITSSLVGAMISARGDAKAIFPARNGLATSPPVKIFDIMGQRKAKVFPLPEQNNCFFQWEYFYMFSYHKKRIVF